MEEYRKQINELFTANLKELLATNPDDKVKLKLTELIEFLSHESK
jgi:hypothetical protein